ncbi:MAG: transcriptional regulator NrdR [Gammaproteobacteria bacterium]|nr:transcriptional regulator NrdR [Gammaproteobacteria bacterium]
MRCPFCRSEDTRVIDSRLADDGDAVRRRRECNTCGERFTTLEHASLRMPYVVKSNGSREAFDELKLRSGMTRALEKRPVDTDAVESAIQRIQHKLLTSGDREVPALQIGEWVMQELNELDQVAYVRFASVYRSFQDVDEFSEEVKRLRNQLSPSVKKKQMSFLPSDDK